MSAPNNLGQNMREMYTLGTLKEMKFHTCHQIDSTIREKIHDSTFSSADVKVLVSCQSSMNSMKSGLLLLSFLLLDPFEVSTLVNELDWHELPNA